MLLLETGTGLIPPPLAAPCSQDPGLPGCMWQAAGFPDSPYRVRPELVGRLSDLLAAPSLYICNDIIPRFFVHALLAGGC